MTSNLILQPLFATWAFSLVVLFGRSFSPIVKSRLARTRGADDKEASEILRSEATRLEGLTRQQGFVVGWTLIPLILAIHGEYPEVLVGTTWKLAFMTFLLGLFQICAPKPVGIWGVLLFVMPVLMVVMVFYIFKLASATYGVIF